MKKFAKFFLSIVFILGSILLLTSCNVGNGKTIIRVSHNQAADHPTNIGLLAFEEFIESRLGDKYDVQIFPNELLGSQVNTVDDDFYDKYQEILKKHSLEEIFETGIMEMMDEDEKTKDSGDDN